MIEIRDAIHGTIGAEVFSPLKAFDAVAATVDLIAPADVVASLQGMTRWANVLDDADAFVAKNHVYTFTLSFNCCKPTDPHRRTEVTQIVQI